MHEIVDSRLQDPELVKQKLNHDTAKIRWSALREHQLQDLVIRVSMDLDLIDVGCQFTLDKRDQVEIWLAKRQIEKVDAAQAQQWQADDRELWAVVVVPWVLVQELRPGSN
jgi:hypothetical protein